MSVYKRKNRWYVYVTHPDGRRYRKCVGTKKAADRVHDKLKALITAGKWDLLENEDVLFSDLVIEYLEYAKVNKARSTFSSDRSRIEKHMLPFFGDMPLGKMTSQTVDGYKLGRVQAGVAPKTLNNELLNLSHMMKTAVRWGYVDKNVVANVTKMRVAVNPARFLNQVEITRLTEAARASHIYPLITTALHTGMRKSELLNLKWSDIDLKQQTITVQSKDDWHTKNYKARIFDLTPVLHDVLRQHEAGQPDPPLRTEYVFTFRGRAIRKDIRRSLRTVMRLAGLEGVTLHTLRHTFASQLVMEGVPLRDVQELMGHQDFRTTLRYAHLSPDHVKRQVLNLPFANGRIESRHNSATIGVFRDSFPTEKSAVKAYDA